MDEEKLLSALMGLSYEDRIEVIWQDVSSRTDKYRELSATDLCGALEVPLGDLETSAWTSWESYHLMKSISLKDYIEEYNLKLSEMLIGEIRYLIKPNRFAEIKAAALLSEASQDYSCDFLTDQERKLIADTYSSSDLDSSDDSSTFYISFYTVMTQSDEPLRFQAETLGGQIYIGTPYDDRDGDFIDPDSDDFVSGFLNDPDL